MRRATSVNGGFSLIEVLVVMLITAIGLMGLAALQAATVTSGKSAHLSSAANQAVGDIAERMRANAGGHGATFPYRTTGTYAQIAGTLPASVACVADCTAVNVAAADLAQWQRTIASNLTGGAGIVTGDAVTGYIVTIAWRERATNADAPAANGACPAAIAAPEEVRCLSAVVRP
jgi:type IV pilus assembly protein PilV